MSKDFDTTLSAAIDLAAAAAQTTGASAARARGRKRTVRTRIAVSTASAVIAAAGATAAFALASPHDGTPQVTTTGPHVTASAKPSPSGTASPSPSASSAANPPATSASPSANPPSSAGVTADPHQAVTAAWLAPGQLPFADTFQWKAQQADPQGSSPIGQSLTPTIFYVPKSTAFQAITMCGDPANLLGRTIGAQHINYGATPAGSGNAAGQFIFFFGNATSAQQSFAWLQSQYGSACSSGTGMAITKTAGDGQTSAAWLSQKGASGPVDAAAYTREYFDLRGSTIAYVFVSSNSRTLPASYDDAAQLSAIAAHLCVYGGPCA